MPAVASALSRSSVHELSVSGVYATPGGTTTVTGSPNTPARRLVRLHNQVSGRLARELWSDAVTGAYVFEHIAAGTYFVISFDHTGTYSGVVETDIVVPAP